MTSVWSELKRRNVVKVAVAYAVVAWLLIEIASTVLPTFNAPQWVLQTITFVIILGFPLALVFAWAFELTPEGLKREKDVERSTSITRQTGRKLDFLIIGVLSVAVVYFVVDRYVWTNEGKPVVAPGTEISLAVLPFVDMSPNKDQEYFADGISEELLNGLAQIPELRVTGRTSSFAFKGLNEDLRTIGEKLDVVYVLEGSVRKSGQTVKITAQLVNANDGYRVWSDTFDRDVTDIFAIQEDIARSVAGALSISLGVGEGDISQGGTRNLEAYDACLEAASVPTFEEAFALLEKAVALDPNYAKAWAYLAGTYQSAANLMEAGSGVDELLRKSDAATQRAIESAPESITALILIGARQWRNLDWIAAERSILRALERAPSNGDANSIYMSILRAMGRPSEALAYNYRWLEIEPLAFGPTWNTGLTYRILGKTDLAMRFFEQALDLDNDSLVFDGMMVLGMQSNDHDLIRQAADRLLASEYTPSDTRLLATALVPLLDSPQAAIGELHRLSTDPTFDVPWSRGALSQWAAYFGDYDLSLQILADVAPRGLWWAALCYWDPMCKDMRRLPGFKTFVQDIGLVDYWRSTGNWGEYCRPVGAEDFECD